jgi:hypothetical protein
MTQVIPNAPRTVRSFLRSKVVSGDLPLLVVGPKQLSSYAGKTGWFFATQYQGNLVTITKKPVATRDKARVEAVVRYGRKVKELRTNNAAKKAA